MSQKKLILVAGPTAVGKTEFCIRLARLFDAEIFSCDSRQFYRELSVGTAKPTAGELDAVRHHFIDNLSVADDYSVATYEKEINAALKTYFIEKDTAVLTGGSGLFMKAVTHGLDPIPDIPATLREELLSRLESDGLDSLVSELKQLDPEYVSKADLKNKQRVIRALEVSRFTGKPFSSWHQEEHKERAFRLIKIGLERPREELYSRINTRTARMLDEGLLEEVKSVAAYRHKNALQTVGYKEVFDYFDGSITFDEMQELIKRNSRRYAKRQLTWFKNQDDFNWFHPDEFDSVVDFIKK